MPAQTSVTNHAPSQGPLIKHLSFLLKWTREISSKTPQSDGNVLQFEDGYLVETVLEGNDIGVVIETQAPALPLPTTTYHDGGGDASELSEICSF
ncbi:hypothetical protein ACFXTH_003067 [Malus domestica]